LKVNFARSAVCANSECKKPRPEQLALNNLRHEGPQMLREWIEANPVLQTGPLELIEWLAKNLKLTKEKPELAEWIEDHPHEAQLRLLGKNVREATASERKAAQLATQWLGRFAPFDPMPSNALLPREITEPKKPAHLSERQHTEQGVQLLFLRNQLSFLVKDIKTLDTSRMREITAQIDLFGDLTLQDSRFDDLSRSHRLQQA